MTSENYILPDCQDVLGLEGAIPVLPMKVTLGIALLIFWLVGY